jgi:hypothetical protein
MAKPLIVKKLKFPLSALRAMPAERRSALLLLGVLVNETNWLYKLLLKTAQVLPKHPTDNSNDPEVQAKFSLTIFLTTTLVGKIHEGWDCICNEGLKAIVDGLSLCDELKNLKARLGTRLSGKLFMRIRNNVAFHYAEKMIDFSNLKDHLDEKSTCLYLTEAGYGGDMLLHLSTLAILDPLLGFADLIPQSSGQRSTRRPLP